jgi:hypothetical protein
MLNEARVEIRSLENRMKELGSRHKFFSTNSSCPTCQQDINENIKSKESNRLKEEAKKLTKSLDEFKKKESDLLNEINEGELKKSRALLSEMTKEMNQERSTLTTLQTSISHFVREIRDLNNKKQSQKDGSFVAQEIENLKNRLTERNQDATLLKSKIRHYAVIGDMLKDTGIRSYVVKDYLPVINKLMAFFLDKFDFFVLFQLDENFNETIKQRHYTDFSYTSFSEGQKNRLNLAMLFTFRELIKMKNAARVNLLFLDEIFQSSLDEEGKVMLLDLLRNDLTDDENVFIISHTPSIVNDDEGFARHLEFEMKDGFSTYTETLNRE